MRISDWSSDVCSADLQRILREGAAMKYITAIIQPHRLDKVREALAALGVHGMTASAVYGYGRQKGHNEVYRGAEYARHYVPKTKLENAVGDSQAAAVNAATIGRAP